MSAEEVRLAVLGDPLAFTLSPELHRAGAAALGLACESAAIRTPVAELGSRLAELAARGFDGVNLTVPLKEAALAHLPRVSDRARLARSVNTVGFAAAGAWGDTTDGDGFVAWLATLERAPAAGEAFLLLGAGGAARSLGAALVVGGQRVLVASREPALHAAAWASIPAAHVRWDGGPMDRALAGAGWIVNATPIADRDPVPFESLPAGARLVDLRYEREITGWVRRARSLGFEAWDGLGLLVHQARRSLALWTGREPPLAALEAAVGWPR